MENSHHSEQYVSPRVLWYMLLIAVSVTFPIVGLLYDFLVPIAVVLAVLFFAVLIYRPFWGFLLYVALVYLRPADLFPVLATIRVQPLLLGLLFVIWLIRDYGIGKNRFKFHRIDLALLVFVVVMAMSILTSIYIGESVSRFTDFIKLCAFYLLATQIIRSEGQLKAFIAVILGSVTFVGLIQIYTYFTIGLTRATGLGGYGIHIGPIHLDAGRAIGEQATNVHGIGGYSSGFLANASELGLGVLMVFPFAYYLYGRVSSRFARIAVILVLITLTMSLIVSGSRGAALAAFAVLFLIFLKSRRKAALVFAAIIGLMAAAPLLSDQYVDRIASTAEYESDESANIRLTLWRAGLRMMIDRPLLGVGVGNFHIAYGGSYREAGSADLWWEPHNNFVQVGSEMGILGLAAYIWLIVLAFRENKRSRERLALKLPSERLFENYLHAIDVSLFGCIVAGSFITSTYYPHVLVLALLARSSSEILGNKIENQDLQLIENKETDDAGGGNPPSDDCRKAAV